MKKSLKKLKTKTKTKKLKTKKSFGAIHPPKQEKITKKVVNKILLEINYSTKLDFFNKEFIEDLSKDFDSQFPFHIDDQEVRVIKTKYNYIMNIKIFTKILPEEENNYLNLIPQNININKNNFNFTFEYSSILIHEIIETIQTLNWA